LVAAAAVGLVAALGPVLGVGSPAAAHGQFVTSDPVPGSQVATALQTIYVFFTEKPTSNAYFAVTAPNGYRVDRVWSHGPSKAIPRVHEWYHQADGRWVVRAYDTAFSAQVPIAYWPETGEYTVEFVSVSTDGQPVRGNFTFRYSGPVSEIPADFRPQRSEPDPNLLAVAPPGAPTAPPTGPPLEEVVEELEAGPGLWVVWVPIGLVLALAVAVLVFWRLRPEQARQIVVSRFGGRYAAPTPRRPLALPPGLAERLPAKLQDRLPARITGPRAPVEAGQAATRARPAATQAAPANAAPPAPPPPTAQPAEPAPAPGTEGAQAGNPTPEPEE
jgi:methionine-rich copper-binding protein CopC